MSNIVPLTETVGIELRSGPQAIDLGNHPSLLAMLHAKHRALTALDAEIAKMEHEQQEAEKNLACRKRMGMPTRGYQSAITRRATRLEQLQAQRDAHAANYLEIPPINAVSIQMDAQQWGVVLPNDVPLDVLRALEYAYNECVFDNFVLYQPDNPRRDPIIAGVAGGAYFYIASWR